MPPRSTKAPYSVRFFMVPVTTAAFGKVLDRGVLARLQLLFNSELAGDHDVAAAAIDLENLDRNILI